MKKIYLATPYWHSDPMVRYRRFDTVNKAAAIFIEQGYNVFSPISHSHPISLYTNANIDWLKQDLPFLDWCDELWILKQDGWQDSEGIKAERIRAFELNKPVKFISCEKVEEQK